MPFVKNAKEMEIYLNKQKKRRGNQTFRKTFSYRK